MKKYLSLLLLLTIFCSVSAQQISVKSFRKLEMDLDAKVNEPLKDQNGDVCAIIKVQTTQSGFYFDGGQLGIKKTELKHGEIWLYVPWGLKRLTISHDKLGVLRDYQLNIPIEKATVYELVLTTGKVITTVEETIDSQWLVINPEPADASVYLNDLFVKSGTYQTKLKPGTYTYRVEAPLYHTEAGKVEINDTKKEIVARLKPAFGYVTVNTEPEKEAKVIIDGKTLTTNTPCKSEVLASGVHTVQVIKEMYQPSTQKVTITDGQTTPLNFRLQPNFAELTITTFAEATLYVNNEQKAKGNWNGRLNPGVYSLEARLDKHRSAKQDIELTAGDVKTANLQPTPIYGSLDIITTPVGANITINGKDYGTTPNTIKNLLIGEYKAKLTKTGYATVNKSIIINDEKASIINETLITGNSYLISAHQKYELKDYVGAVQDYSKVIELDPLNVQAYKERGSYYFTVQNYNEAISDFTKIIEILPNDSIYFIRGLAKYKLKNNVGAISDFNKSLKINPNNSTTKEYLEIVKREIELNSNTVKDIDGNVYHTVKIGTQTWMVENLKTTHYQNGDPIPKVTNNSSWSTLNTGAWCDYDNSAANGTKYGHLYNWYAVNTSNLAPSGWHVATDTEWTTLDRFVNDNLGATVSVFKVLAAKTNWYIPLEDGGIDILKSNNILGFTALPGGTRQDDGNFYGLEVYGEWWSSTESDPLHAYFRTMNYIYYGRGSSSKSLGYSVRCVKDN